MMKFLTRIRPVVLCGLLCACAGEHSPGGGTGEASQGSDQAVDFSVVTEQVFGAGSCLNCHNDSFAVKGVNLASYAAVMARPGLVVPGEPDQSQLLMVVTPINGSRPRMPAAPGVPLNESALGVLRSWIAGGAVEFATSNP